MKKINILVAIFRNVGYTMFQWEGEDAFKAQFVCPFFISQEKSEGFRGKSQENFLRKKSSLLFAGDVNGNKSSTYRENVRECVPCMKI